MVFARSESREGSRQRRSRIERDLSIDQLALTLDEC